jgi:hypothetical protein
MFLMLYQLVQDFVNAVTFGFTPTDRIKIRRLVISGQLSRFILWLIA